MMTENAKSMRYAARWNTEHISMTPLSQLDALRQNSLTASWPPLKVITHTFGQFGSFLGPTWDISQSFAPEKWQVTTTGEAPIPQNQQDGAFSTWVNQAGSVRQLAGRIARAYAQGSRVLTFWPHFMPEVKHSQMLPPPE